MSERKARRQPRYNKTPRPCMCCKNTFLSEGPHNRLCKNCRHASTKMVPMDDSLHVHLRRR